MIQHKINEKIQSGGDAKFTRLAHIDVAKGIGMIAVVFGHCLAYAGLTGTRMFATIYTFHMPYFFFLSGYLYKRKEAVPYFYNKVKTLLIPMMIYQVLNMFIFSFWWCVGKTEFFRYTSFGAFWFIITLLYVSVGYYVIDFILARYVTDDRKKDYLTSMISTAFCVAGLIYASYISDQPNQPIATSMVGFFFYSAGELFNRYIDPRIKDFNNRNKFGKLTIFGIGTALLICLYLTSTMNRVTVDMNTSRYGNVWIFLPQACTGIIAVYLVAYIINSNKILQFYGENSLVILMVHIPMWKSMSLICSKLGIYRWSQAVICFAFSMLMSTIAVIIFNKYLPFLAGRVVLEKNNNGRKVKR